VFIPPVSTVYLHSPIPWAPRDPSRVSAEVARTLDVFRALAADRDDMVVKALSWGPPRIESL
jgi:hypothetical protein